MNRKIIYLGGLCIILSMCTIFYTQKMESKLLEKNIKALSDPSEIGPSEGSWIFGGSTIGEVQKKIGGFPPNSYVYYCGETYASDHNGNIVRYIKDCTYSSDRANHCVSDGQGNVYYWRS